MNEKKVGRSFGWNEVNWDRLDEMDFNGSNHEICLKDFTYFYAEAERSRPKTFHLKFCWKYSIFSSFLLKHVVGFWPISDWICYATFLEHEAWLLRSKDTVVVSYFNKYTVESILREDFLDFLVPLNHTF